MIHCAPRAVSRASCKNVPPPDALSAAGENVVERARESSNAAAMNPGRLSALRRHVKVYFTQT